MEISGSYIACIRIRDKKDDWKKKKSGVLWHAFYILGTW